MTFDCGPPDNCISPLSDSLAVGLDWGNPDSSGVFVMLEGTSIVLLTTVTGLVALMSLSFIIVLEFVALAGGATSAGCGKAVPGGNAGPVESAGPYNHVSSTGDFSLAWTINCPLCATVRVH